MHPHELRKICQLAERKSAREGCEHVILMAGQNVVQLQLPNDFGKSAATIGQRHTQNGKIDLPKDGLAVANMSDGGARRGAGNTARIDVNSLARGLDHKREWLAHAPIRYFDRPL